MGNSRSDFMDESFGVPVADILGNLKGAFMINAEVSKGKFFASPGYIYTKLGTEDQKYFGKIIKAMNIPLLQPRK